MKQKFALCSLLFGICAVATAHAAPAPNPRTGGVVSGSQSARAEARDVNHTVRSATRRTATVAPRETATSVQEIVTNRAARQTVSAPRINETTTARTGTVPSVARSATSARSATVSPMMQSRAGSSRATAVFDDVSKMGTGYSNCRDSYNTCMDQFCAKANDTFRRCFCSSKFTGFIETEAALDRAKTLLMQFEDNNLNAVDKTAAEVSAMYSATVGEKAIKNDVSAAQSVLNEIGDLLSGKQKVNKTNALSTMTLDFTLDMDDIWSGGSSTSIFGGSGADLSAKEGLELYNAAHKQCSSLIGANCDSSTVANMVKSSYNILISQDCNAYQKKIDAQKEAVKTTVRQAEKYLREARLEEYRSHNTADVNECIAKVKAAVTTDAACGANYKKCLDYTGNYININTGEPIYSPMLFKLSGLLKLENTSGSIASLNPNYNKFMDGRKMFAETALDTCRDKAALVWEEFKRTAMIEIAQAQDAKIEEVKNSCVTTMKECYDAQSGALASFDTTAAQATGALNAYAARTMCADKVAACAALYGSETENQNCNFDTNGKLTNPTQCGMAALLNFVSTVDNVKVAEGCVESLNNYAQELCTPTSGTEKYPYNCRSYDRAKLNELFQARANTFCKDPTSTGTASTAANSIAADAIDKILGDVESNLYNVMDTACEKAGGIWVDYEDAAGNKKEAAFYQTVFGGNVPSDSDAKSTERGYCIQNTVRYQCLAQEEATGGLGYVSFDSNTGMCNFTSEWYRIQCEKIGGYWNETMCYL